MTNIKVYSFDKKSNQYVGEASAYPDPLDHGNYLIPAFSTTIEPNLQEGYVSTWNGEAWINEEILPDVEPVVSPEQLKIDKEARLRNLVSAEISKPLLCKNIDGQACYILTGKKSKFIGCESLAENETRYFKAVDENGTRLSYDLKLNSSELQELSRHYREREDTVEELQENYIDQIEAATTVEELNNINFEELE